MRTALLALLLTGCGLSAQLPTEHLVSFTNEDTAAGLLANYGQPCSRSKEGAAEVWAYCAALCWDNPTQWCINANACEPECPTWRAWIVAGYVTQRDTLPPVEGP